MTIETILNACAKASAYWAMNDDRSLRRKRQYRAFRARILRMFEEKDIADGRLELLREFRSTVKKEMGEVWSYFEDYNPGLIERLAEELGDEDI
jgi:hypothetical protein